jgi:hypothetical protein
VENKDGYKHQSRTENKHRSRRDHKHKHQNKDEQRSRKKDDHDKKARAMVGATHIDSSSSYSASRSSRSEDECDRRMSKKVSKNLSGMSCFACDGFSGMAHNSGSKKIQKEDSDFDSEDEVCDELFSLR